MAMTSSSSLVPDALPARLGGHGHAVDVELVARRPVLGEAQAQHGPDGAAPAQQVA